ncbi:MAG: T9SS type A sorting domain-containing protein [Saprospiraceae bacterium]
MKIKYSIFIFSFFLTGVTTLLNGQAIQSKDPSVIGAAGGIHTNHSISLEWTLGETFVASNTINNKMYIEGYHQPFLAVKNIPAQNSLADKYQVLISPNPTSGLLNVAIKTNETANLNIHLIDIAGRILMNEKVSGGSQDLQLQLLPFAEGLYLLSITNDLGYRIHSFKVIKQ